jgi:hypothetical protein
MSAPSSQVPAVAHCVVPGTPPRCVRRRYGAKAEPNTADARNMHHRLWQRCLYYFRQQGGSVVRPPGAPDINLPLDLSTGRHPMLEVAPAQ